MDEESLTRGRRRYIGPHSRRLLAAARGPGPVISPSSQADIG
jgi:hypothetical protein